MPPFFTDEKDEGKRKQYLAEQLQSFDPQDLAFPEWVSEELRTFIRGNITNI